MAQIHQPSSPPVVLMFFNRPEVTEQVMDVVRRFAPAVMFLVQDGPRHTHPDDEALCARTRAVAENIDWECEVLRIYADSNLGVRQRFLTGLDEVFAAVESAIILEDDCLPDESFFPYCEDLLARFADDHRVGIISGNNFLGGARVSDDSYFFTPDVRIWGWATWRRVWQEFSVDVQHRMWSEKRSASAIERLHSPIRRRSMARMAAAVDSLDSWAVSFVLHCLQRGYLNVMPAVNLVRNIGFGAESTHTSFHSFTDDIQTGQMPLPLTHPTEVVDLPHVGVLEARTHRRLWLSFPLRHPIDFTRRVLGHLRQKVLR